MASTKLRAETPSSQAEAAELLAECGAAGRAVRIRGAGTKLWGNPGEEPEVELSAAGLDRVLEHNEGDLTAILEAGVPVAAAQERFGQAGQMLALDPPLGGTDGATIGGVVSAADSGPRRHRYGSGRDLVIGVRVALSDGTVAKAGGKVIKNVAGYDLGKLFTGAFGTLGLILQVAVRLHPLPKSTATAMARSGDAAALARAAGVLARSRIEKESLDVRWSGGEGALLARFGGTEEAARRQAEAALEELAAADCAGTELVEHDDELWNAQRAAQHAAGGAVIVRVSGEQRRLAETIAATERAGGSLVGRVALGLHWVALPAEVEPIAAVEGLRSELAPAPCAVLDAPAEVRAALDPWGEPDGPGLGLMRRLKSRFDPAGVCNPGVFVGGI